MIVNLDKYEAASLIEIVLAWFDAESLTDSEEVQLHQITLDKLTRAAGQPRVDLYARNLDNFEKGR